MISINVNEVVFYNCVPTNHMCSSALDLPHDGWKIKKRGDKP